MSWIWVKDAVETRANDRRPDGTECIRDVFDVCIERSIIANLILRHERGHVALLSCSPCRIRIFPRGWRAKRVFLEVRPPAYQGVAGGNGEPVSYTHLDVYKRQA